MIRVEDLEIVSDIYDELKSEMSWTDDLNEKLLLSKVESATREVCRCRDYPDNYTDKMIVKDLNRWHSTISRIALYDYNQAGSEGETMHIENNTQRMWKDRKSLFYGLTPIGRLVY